MNETELSVSIELYGSDLDYWPESLRNEILSDSQLFKDFQWMATEEAAFEQQLLNRSFEPHSEDLVHRIIAESLIDEQGVQNNEFTSFRQSPFIRPLLGMAATLVLGLAIGYGLPLTQDADIEESFEDYTALLYVEGDFL
jgi:hypothetical protein